MLGYPGSRALLRQGFSRFGLEAARDHLGSDAGDRVGVTALLGDLRDQLVHLQFHAHIRDDACVATLGFSLGRLGHEQDYATRQHSLQEPLAFQRKVQDDTFQHRGI